MELLNKLFGTERPIYVGDFAIGVNKPRNIDMFDLVCRLALKYIRTGRVERDVGTLTEFLVVIAKNDCAAKWDWLMRRGKGRDYIKPAIVAGIGILLPLLFAKRWYTRMATAVVTLPLTAVATYATLPRESLSAFKMRKEAMADMGDESDATECLEVWKAKSIKGPDGEEVVTGSRITRVVAKVKPKRNRYAAKIAQVARSKVGYLSNTPENRLIYQRVLIEILDKDCVRYCDRDVLLPVAIGLCFVYQEGVREASQLWGSTESLGLK